MSKLLDFENLHNIRDLGGMATEGGGVIMDGRFIRCGNLSFLSFPEKRKLGKLVEMIVDFRSDKERAEKPDVLIKGIEYLHIPIVDSLTAGVTREKESDESIIARLAERPEDAKAYMCNMYRNFAGERAAAQYGRFVRLLLTPREKAVMWHCTAGKDRAGIASAIVEEILGVPRMDIVGDYLETNIYLEADIKFLTEFVKQQARIESDMADEALRYLFGAETEYIEAFYSEVEKQYGDFNGYVRDGLGISDDECEKMRAEYLSA